MSDDLVKRLREDQPVTQDMESTMQCALQDEAADRIEELESKLSLRTNLHEECIYLLKSTEAKLAKAVEAGKTMDDGCDCERCNQARATLAELTGGKDE